MIKYVIIIICIYLILVNFTDILENYNVIYKDHISRLNNINKIVRKGIYEVKKGNKKIINWIINLIKDTGCNVIVNDNIYHADPRVEFNYSHTIQDKIILSDRDYKSLVKYYNERDNMAIYTIGSTIVHESVHISQRYNYEKYKELYTMWGYIFVNDIKNIDILLEFKRENPDAQDNNILWGNRGRYYFINCFYDKNNIDPYNVECLAYEISKTGDNYEYKGGEGIKLEYFTDYNNYFGRLGNNYTPNEICAEYEEIYFMECLGNNRLFYNKAYQIFKNFFKK